VSVTALLPCPPGPALSPTSGVCGDRLLAQRDLADDVIVPAERWQVRVRGQGPTGPRSTG
jgi:hypothetical protein